MRTSRLVMAMLVLLMLVVPATAVDLTKIDRTIGKEPAYGSKPKYCLVVFGPEAKSRVWLVLDTNVLYVDRNANGDLTEPGKGVIAKGFLFKIGSITETDEKTMHDLMVEVKPG